MSYEHYTLQGLTLPPNAGQQQSQSLQSNTASLHNALVQQHHHHRQHVRQQRVRVPQQSSSAPVRPQQPAQAQQPTQQLQQSSMGQQQQQQKYNAPPPVAPQPQQEEPIAPQHMTAVDGSTYLTQKGPYGSGEIEEGYSLEFQNLDEFMAWKANQEEENCVEFIKGDSHHSKAVPPRFKEHTKLVCARHSRSGRKKYVKKHPERQRKTPSRKIEGSGCPASISYKTYYDSPIVRASYHAQHSHEIGPANYPFTRKGRRELAEKAKNKRASTVVPHSTTGGGQVPAALTTNQSYGSNHADDDDDDDGGANGSGGRSGLPLSPRSMEDGVDLNGIGGMDVEVDPVLQPQQPMSSNGLYTSPSAGPSGTVNRGTAGMGLPTPHSITSATGSQQGPVPPFQPPPSAPLSTASQHQHRPSIGSSHRPPQPPPQPQSQPQPRSQPQSALHSPQQAPPRVNGIGAGSAAALQAIFGPNATAQQITQDRWNRLELIFQHVRSQAVNYEFPGATLSALEMLLIRMLLETPGIGIGP